jgi:hypothetical protein
MSGRQLGMTAWVTSSTTSQGLGPYKVGDEVASVSCLATNARTVKLVRIGYWTDGPGFDWPDPTPLVDESISEAELALVADYLERGFVAAACLGKSTCRLCAKSVGGRESTDGTFIWPEGLPHYVRVHKVRLPSRVIDHVNQWVAALEGAERDESWWKNQARMR